MAPPMFHRSHRFCIRVAPLLTVALLRFLPFTASLAAQATGRFDTVFVDASGQLHIATTDHRYMQPPKDSDQVGFDKAAISPDRRSAGWLALFPNCCTSYPVPLKLVVYHDGAVRAFMGTELPVWRWRFDSTSTRVAFYQETVHGGFGAHYELRDIVTGDLIAQYDPSDSIPTPAWAVPLTVP
jgi:hypothetical protein